MGLLSWMFKAPPEIERLHNPDFVPHTPPEDPDATFERRDAGPPPVVDDDSATAMRIMIDNLLKQQGNIVKQLKYARYNNRPVDLAPTVAATLSTLCGALAFLLDERLGERGLKRHVEFKVTRILKDDKGNGRGD